MTQGSSADRKISAWAVAGLVLGILGVALLVVGKGGLGIAAVFCGHAGLSDVRRHGRTGRGLAIAALVLGYFAVVVVVATVLQNN